MSFIVEKLVGDGWVLSEGPVVEKWRAREIARTSGTPASPSRVVDLSEGKGKVLCLYGRTEPPFPHGWKVYKATDRRGDENKMDTTNNQTPVPDTTTEKKPEVTSQVLTTPPPPVVSSSTTPATTSQPHGAAVEALMEGTDDDEEGDAEVPIPVSVSIGTKTVALLFSGGTFSTATLINLIARGYEITPYYLEDSEFEGTERELKIARSVIRIARSSTKAVKDLEVITIKIPKKQEARRRRFYVETLTKELMGSGFNAIAYGSQPLEVGEDVSEDLAEDTDTSSLEECTPLEIVCPDSLDLGSLEQQIAPFVASTVARDMLLASSSCEEPGETKRECGDCRTCKNRFRLFFRLFGDATPKKYMKDSWVRKRIADLNALVESKGEASPSAEEIEAILYPKKKKNKDEAK